MKLRMGFEAECKRILYAILMLYFASCLLRYLATPHRMAWWLQAADVVFQAFLAFVCFTLIYEQPALTFTEEGVYVRRLFRWQFHSWDSFAQAGILWILSGVRHKNHLILLQSGGSRRTPGDKTFLLRNYGKVLHLPCKDKPLHYVKQYHGLDFNLSDGRAEAFPRGEGAPEGGG